MNNHANKVQKKLIIFHPSIEGAGVEKNLFIIANYLSKKIDVSVLTSNKSDQFLKSVNLITPFFNVKENTGRPIKYLICIIMLIYKCILNRKNFTVLSFQANIYAIIICYIFNIKIISRSNSSPSGWSKNTIKQVIFNFFLKKADCIITNSIDFKKELDNKFKVKSKLILNPFDIKKIIKLSKEKIKLNFFKKNYLKIVNVARLTDQKDHITLVKAIKIAVKKRKIQLIIVGRGVFYSIIKKYISENNLEDNILMIGYQKNPFKFMRLCDIFVLSSVFEGHPNVLVEAQVLKKYIISTDCPTGPNEILGNGKYGSLIKVGDYEKLASLLINFKKNKINKNKIKKGFKNLGMYNYENNCHAYLNLILPFLKK